MKLITLNVHCGYLPWVSYGLRGDLRLARIIGLLASEQADVIALQEVHDPAVAQWIRASLPMYHWAHTPNHVTGWATVLAAVIFLALYLWAWWGLLLAAIIVYGARSGVGQFALHGNPGLLLGWRPSLAPTGAVTWQPFRHQAGDWHNRLVPRGYQTLTLNNGQAIHHTHLDADGDGQMLQVAELPLTDHSAVLGDLNVSPDSTVVRYLQAEGWACGSTLTPTWVGPNDWLYRYLYGRLPTLRLDYIFTRVPTEWATVPTAEASDHALVTATF